MLKNTISAPTHVIVDPQIDRSATPNQDPDLALRVVSEGSSGIVVRGAKALGTLAPLAQEVLVYLSASYALREESQFVQWFAIPIATPGLKVVCRQPLSVHAEGYGHPFARRFDEQEAILIFDDVLVPWERVFLLRDGKLALRGLGRTAPWGHFSTNIRFYHRTLTLFGVAAMIAEAIGVDGRPEVRDKLGELVTYLELYRLALVGVEAEAYLTPGGLLAPAVSPALGIYAAQISGRLSEIVRQIGTSGLIMQPSERDLANPALRPFLDRYMRGKKMGVVEKSRLFRLGWDLVVDSFGMRQDLYEFLHRGDISRNRTNLYLSYDRTAIADRIAEMIRDPCRTTAGIHLMRLL